MSEFEVEKGVKPPPIGRRSAYPWNEMKPGDSFFVATELQGDVLNSLRGLAHRAFGKGNYSTRRTTKNGVLGVRVWRLK